MVLAGLVIAWRLAKSPTSRSPALEMATIEGVVRLPSSFSIILGLPPSITAMAELVVPKSMPKIFAIIYLKVSWIKWRPLLAPGG